jgi:hypothetical protein
MTAHLKDMPAAGLTVQLGAAVFSSVLGNSGLMGLDRKSRAGRGGG